MSPYSTDSSTWSSAAGAAPACPDTAATLPRARSRLDQPPDRDPPQPRRDVAVTAKTPRFLPDRDESVTDRVRHQVAVVAPPGEPDREPPGVTLIQRAEGAHVTLGDSGKQRLIARAAVHDLTVASPDRKRFTPRREFPRAFRSRVTVPNPAKAADGGRQTDRAS